MVKVLRYREIMRVEISKKKKKKKRKKEKCWGNKKYQYSVFLTVDMLLMVARNPIIKFATLLIKRLAGLFL